MTDVDLYPRAIARASHLAAAIANHGEPGELLRRCVDGARACTHVDLAAIVVPDASSTSLAVRTASIPGLETSRSALQGFAASVLRFNRGEVIPDLGKDPRREELAAATGIRHALCAPIRLGAQPRGVLVLGSRNAGARPDDAALLGIAGLFADLTAQIFAAEAAATEERRFHQRLASLAKGSTPMPADDGFGPALRAISRKTGLALAEGPSCDPVLPELCQTIGADAAAVTRLHGDGIYRVVESWRLPAEATEGLAEESSEVDRIHDAGRFACRTPVQIGPFDQSIRVLVDSRAGRLVLHVLAGRGRLPFDERDVRCAELAAVRLAWNAHASVLEDELLRAQGSLARGAALS